MASKKNPPPSAPAYAVSAFAKLAQTQALALKIESAPAFDFSEQTRAALDQARADPSLDNLGVACRLAAAELEGKRALGDLVKTLSLAIAMPAPGARGAGNLLYPAFGTGLAATGTGTASDGVRASLVSFSSQAHLVQGQAAPLEAWAPATRDTAPAAHWIEKNALMALRGAHLGEPQREPAKPDYLSARWVEMSARVRSNSEVASLSMLLSPEADKEDREEQDKLRRVSHERESRGEAGPGRRAVGRILLAQRELMRALESSAPGSVSVFETAAAKWSERKSQEDALTLAQESSRGRSGGDFNFRSLGRIRGLVEEALDGELWAEGQSQAGVELRDWLQERLPLWDELPKSEDGVWTRSRVELFEQEMALGGLMRTGESVFKNGLLSHGGFHVVFEYVAAAIYAALSPPSQDPAAREREQHNARSKLRGMAPEAMHGMMRGGLGQGFGRGRGIDPRMLMELPMMIGDWTDGALRFKARAQLEQGEAPALSASPKTEASAWEGIEELLGLADQCLLAATRLARERELAALESMGLPASAELVRGDETGLTARFNLMHSKEEQRRALEQTDPMARALSLHGQLFAPRDRSTPVEHATKLHAARSGSKAEMEAFFQSPMGEVYIEALQMIASMEPTRSFDSPAMVFYQACLQEFRDPSPTPTALSERPMSEQTKKGLFKFINSGGGGFESRQTLGWLDQLQTASPGATWEQILSALGPDEGVAFLSVRAEAIERQCPKAARWVVETELGIAPRDPKPLAMDARPLKRNDYQSFLSLPYGHEPDASLRSRCAGANALEPGDFEDQSVAKLLRAEGFAGEAALAAKLAYGEIETRPGADDRSRANAWLAAGKRLCKEELGMTEASYQAAKAHASTGKRLASLFPRVVKVKAAERERLRSLALESGQGVAVAARKALRLSGLLGSALSRSMSANRAYVVGEAIAPGKASSGELDVTFDYLRQAMGPMSSGLSASEVFASLRREMKARQALSERFDAALLERSDELLKASEAAGKTEAQAERGAVQALRRDLERVDDWAADNAGAFYTRLNPKLRWAHLRRGEEEWHQEVIVRQASSGQGWEPALGSWSDPTGQWSAEELLTPTELAKEGAAMRHCVGGYSSYCRDGNSRIFSIKKNGVRALTAQFESGAARSVAGELETTPSVWKLKQNKGPCNAEPTKEGAQITKALGEALQARWDLRVEEKVKKVVKQIGEIKAQAKPGEFEIPGFLPETMIDLGKLRRPAKKAPEGEGAEAARIDASVAEPAPAKKAKKGRG